MLRINEGDYAYSSALVRAIEIRLLDTGRFDRMLDASTAEEALKILTEAEYGNGGGNTGSVAGFEELLSDEMMKCYSLLLEIAPQPEIIKAFQRRHDYFNVKVLLKAEFSGNEAPSILMGAGTIEKEKMKRIIREREYSELTPIMQQAVEETYDVFSRTQDPQAIDLLMDKASYRQFASDLKEVDNLFLHEFADITVDITNIKMFIRARSLNKSWDFIRKLLLEGGTIPQNIYPDNCDKTIDSFIDALRTSRYGETVRKGWELFKTKKNISGLEKLLDDYMMKFVQGSKMILMGIEPLIAYLFAKEAEIRNVRIIMTGKVNRLPIDLIRERLRLGYV